MTTFSPYGGPPTTGLPTTRVNTPIIGTLPGAIRSGFRGDTDPITPGHQTRHEVVTATRPTQFTQAGV
jgi:hypothetical protein